ncbi:hypothetical protein [Roseateles sp. P5_E11]
MNTVTTEAPATTIVFDGEARDAVEVVWGKIMTVAQEVVKSHEQLGFELISKKINPSLADIVRSLRVIETLLNTLMCAVEEEDLSLNRQWLNAQQQIHLIEVASLATHTNDEHEYHKAIEALKKQAVF